MALRARRPAPNPRPRRGLALAAVLFVMLAGGQEARAGQYDVHSCKLPDGTPIGLVGYQPIGDVDAWFDRTDGCATGAGFFDVTMRADPRHASGATVRWLLNLGGTNVTLRRMRADVAVRTRQQSVGGLALIADLIAFNGQGNFSTSSGGGRGSLARWDDPANAIDTGAISPAGGYVFGVACQGGTQATCDPLPGTEPKSYVRVYRAQATLEDLVDPRVDSFAGALASTLAPHRGIEGFALRATDVGAGVYRLVVELDGRPVASQVIDANAGQCRDQYPTNFSAYDFLGPVPCKLDVNGSFALDTRQFPDGSYTATFAVEDAAGNRRVALGPVKDWVVDNVPAPSVEGAPYVTPRDPHVGGAVACRAGRWSFHGAAQIGDFAYRWQSSGDGIAWRQILGETEATYVAGADDVGRALRCEVTARSSEGATTVASTETLPVTGASSRLAVPGPPAVLGPLAQRQSAADLHLGCGRRVLSLISATARENKVRLTGVVAAAHRGSRVALLESGRHVASTVPRSDGFFDALVSRPSRRRFARVRYQAAVAGVRSVSLKLPQDLVTSSIALLSGDRTVEVAGRVNRRGYRPVTVRRILCGRYETVARGLTDRRGRYRVRFAAPRARAGLYRVETRVGRGRRGSGRRGVGGRLVRAYARARAITFAEDGSG